MTAEQHLEGDWWPAPVPANVRVGARSHLYSSYAFLHYRSERPVGVRIGDDTGVYDGTVFELGPDGEVVIGDFSTVVAPVFCTNGRVEIGDYVFVSHDVFITDAPAPLPPTARRAPDPDRTATITIADDCWIGTRAVLLAGAELGRGSVIGAGTVVDFIVPEYAVVAGNPAAVVGSARAGTGR